jgi:lysozyme
MPTAGRPFRTATGALLVLVGLVLMAYALYSLGIVRLNYPSTKSYPVRGIDVSSVQGNIDWKALTGVRFAYIKASVGSTLQDALFRQNWRAARGHVARGPYHFFSFCAGGVAQAENFMAVAPMQESEMPPAIDVASAGNCRPQSSDAVIAANLESFVRTLRSHHVRTPVLFATPEVYERFIQHRFKGFSVWIRDVIFRPTAAAYPGLALWQYAANGRVTGIGPLVDLDVYLGTETAFRDLLRKG